MKPFFLAYLLDISTLFLRLSGIPAQHILIQGSPNLFGIPVTAGLLSTLVPRLTSLAGKVSVEGP